MIKGVGNDIIEIERIRRAIERYQEKFLDRLFTQKEQDYCLLHKDPAIRFAGRFAAKESVVKALGTGFRDGLIWHDIEIINDSKGKPTVLFSQNSKKMFQDPHVELSISHCRSYATAFAVWIG